MLDFSAEIWYNSPAEGIDSCFEHYNQWDHRYVNLKKSASLDELREKYDKLLHLAKESGLERSEVIAHAKNLFEGFNDVAIYDAVIGAYEIEAYQDARAKGLTTEDAAHNAEVSAYVMNKALVGQGLTLERFVDLIQAELFARAQMVAKMLGVIERADNSTVVNAAAMMLEKTLPERYGKTLVVPPGDGEKSKQVILNFTVAPED